MSGLGLAAVGRAPDVVVVGGGIVGVASAAHLAALGRRVVLIERSHLAAGASGRNSGVVQHPLDPVLIDLHLETLRLYRDLADRDAGPFTLPAHPAGLLLVTNDPAVARRVTETLVTSHPELAPTFLDPDATQALEPAVARGVAACRLEMGFPVAPAAATHAYASWAEGLGVAVWEGRAARPRVVSGRVAGVELDGGERLAAGEVVVAAGPWTPEVIDPGGSWRPIQASWGLVASITLAAPPTHILEEAEIDIEPGDASRSAAVDAGHAFSLVPAGADSTLGSTFLDDEPDPVGVLPSILARGATFVPAVAMAGVRAHRVCARPLSRDGRPLVGRVPGIDGLWVAAGHGPWGISTGPASGRLIADLLDGRVAAPPAALDPGRFGRPPLA